MPRAATRWIKRLAEYCPKDDADNIPGGTRGIYVLFRHRRRTGCYDVVYVGLSRSGIRSRVRGHRKSAKIWSHFSVFEVWENVSDAEIAELEGLFRHIYRRDSRANRFNKQKTHKPLRRVRVNDLLAWQPKEVARG